VTDVQRDFPYAEADATQRIEAGRIVPLLNESPLASSAGRRLAVSIVLLAIVAALDFVTGPEISFSVFYLAPVAVAGGLVSRRAGWAVACLSAVVWGLLDLKAGRGYSSAWIPCWNSAVRLGFFLIVSELISKTRSANARLRELSRTDALTGLANANVFRDQANRVLAQMQRDGRPFTIVYIDLDRFKQVNDEFGHAEGDRLLRAIASLIEGGLRKTDLVSRLGGDEFGVLMPDTGVEQAAESLQRVTAGIARGVEDRWAIGATFGAVTFVEAPDDVDSAVSQADALMYRGKSEGRGRILQAVWPDNTRGA
jgi:diguanylate cyclase (GGDEF)-like protein